MREPSTMNLKEIMKKEFEEDLNIILPLCIAIGMLIINLKILFPIFEDINQYQGAKMVFILNFLLFAFCVFVVNFFVSMFALANIRYFVKLTAQYGDMFEQPNKRIRKIMTRTLSCFMSLFPFVVFQIINFNIFYITNNQDVPGFFQLMGELVGAMSLTMIGMTVFYFVVLNATRLLATTKDTSLHVVNPQEEVIMNNNLETKYDFLCYKYTHDFILTGLNEKLCQLKKVDHGLSEQEVSEVNERFLALEKIIREYSFIRYQQRHFIKNRIEYAIEDLMSLMEQLLLKNDQIHISRIKRKLDRMK
jgi:hypothetical protein